jgi:DNA-binding response OmpR family regulator
MSEETEAGFSLFVVHEGGTDQLTRTFSRCVTIGRTSDCGLVLSHPLVSRRHAEVELRADGSFVVRDLRSSNGTKVEGQHVHGQRVVSRAPFVVELGPYTITVRAGTAPNDETVVITRFAREARLKVEPGKRKALVDGLPVPRLSPLEFQLLELLCAAGSDVVSNNRIGNRLWREGQWDNYMLHNLVRRLRKKLESVRPGAGKLIESLPGTGYRAI